VKTAALRQNWEAKQEGDCWRRLSVAGLVEKQSWFAA
jgi:hypothetical protein